MSEKIHSLSDLRKAKEKGLKTLYPDLSKIMVGMSSCGLGSGAKEVFWKIIDEKVKHSIEAATVYTGCLGYCQREPLVDISIPGMPRMIYKEITVDKVEELMANVAKGTVKKEWVLGRIDRIDNMVDGSHYVYFNNGNGQYDVPLLSELPFYQRQLRIALRNCGFVKPESVEEYIARDGYFALYNALDKLTPEKTIKEVSKSGLRGRGGAGFPTAKKWMLCRLTKADNKYVICNASEGDPGAYMDRSVLEGDPYSILEGMTIGAYAVGANEGYIYIPIEYHLAIEKLRHAIKHAEENGLLGTDIFGSGFDFSINISLGGGAFVCGEETALMASVEGRIGEPRPRPPFPVESGLWNKPTVINNVETWANVPPIILKGGSWYSKIGIGESKGTKVFSLVGNIENTGLVEVPMGIPLEEMLIDVGGGIPEKKKLKAVQTGGPSGGCIPPNEANIAVDYESLAAAGSIMGSGGMVVMDEETCIVDIARYFLNFTKNESCGKCILCREGTARMLELLTNITEGKGKEGDIELLEELSQAIIDGSLCALGRTTPNPVITTLRYFREEYEAHVKYKRCPAIRCKKIIYTSCKYNCPLHTDVPMFIALIAKDRYREAMDVIRQNNPLPIICGYICHHPCEDRCRSVEGAEPMSIKGLKRFVGDMEIKKGYRPAKSTKKKRSEKVAVIGAGPAGLTAAFDLCQIGYGVTIFEASTTAGGMLATAIPEFRLPNQILRLEIQTLLKTGIDIRFGVKIGRDLSLQDLFKEGFKAIFLATGAHKGLKMDFPGEDVDGVEDAMDILKKVKAGQPVNLGKRIAIVGGGNAAIDVARTAWRLGAREIKMIFHRTRDEMPAMRAELEKGIEEGIGIIDLAKPVKVVANNGRLRGLECVKMKLGGFESTGERRVDAIPGSEFIIEADTVCVALGQIPDLTYLPSNDGYKISGSNTLIVDEETMATNVEGVFAGGEVVLGASTIADSMAQGQIAAQMINKYINGQSLAREYEVMQPTPYVEPIKLTQEEIAALKRPLMPCLAVEERRNNFKQVVLGFTEDTARIEAKRCLRCDLKE